MKRFGLSLSDEVYAEFLRYFPDYGSRSVILRRCIVRLTNHAKLTGRIWDREADEIADNILNRQSQSVQEIENEIYGNAGSKKEGEG